MPDEGAAFSSLSPFSQECVNDTLSVSIGALREGDGGAPPSKSSKKEDVALFLFFRRSSEGRHFFIPYEFF